VQKQTETRPDSNMPSMSDLAWPALLRKLDRLDPSFRD
jgi:hypothetical protein